MNDVRKAFVTQYLVSLMERTRSEKSGTKWGIDWVVYNLGLALYGKPIRLPFIRQAGDTTAKTKTEAEFGTDVSFISEDGSELVVFVLKDEALTYKTWITNGFEDDLRRATSPDLNAAGINSVRSVRIVLAYNSDEDQNGVASFDRFVGNQSKTLRDSVALSFERWNLSELVDLTLKHLLNPSLLPQTFFGQLTYLSAQFSELMHGSEAWEAQLVPGWHRFVNDVLAQGSSERGVALLPVALIILREHGATNKSFETGWIELVEIAALAMWKKSLASEDPQLQARVIDFWNSFYIEELFRFYSTHIEALATENSIDQIAGPAYVGAVAAGAMAHWHLGRIGILAYSLTERRGDEEEGSSKAHRQALHEMSNWIVRLLNANQSGYRPLLDIHHIEWFLAAFALLHAHRAEEIKPLLQELAERLYLRRTGHSKLPFIDGSNSLDNVFEHVTTMGEDSQIVVGSSAFVLMLLELCFFMPAKERQTMLAFIHSHLVLGGEGDGEDAKFKDLHLVSWIPPTDWTHKVLEGTVEDGEEVTVGPFTKDRNADGEVIADGLRNLVEQMRAASSFPGHQPVPMAALILACIRFRSPLPTELWRRLAFPVEQLEPVEA